jgi:hypothetical protein
MNSRKVLPLMLAATLIAGVGVAQMPAAAAPTPSSPASPFVTPGTSAPADPGMPVAPGTMPEQPSPAPVAPSPAQATPTQSGSRQGTPNTQTPNTSGMEPTGDPAQRSNGSQGMGNGGNNGMKTGVPNTSGGDQNMGGPAQTGTRKTKKHKNKGGSMGSGQSSQNAPGPGGAPNMPDSAGTSR